MESTFARTRNAARIGTAPVIPDLSSRIVKAVRVENWLSHWTLARIALAALAVQIMVTSVRPLIFGVDGGTSVHEARHLGAFTAAYAVALLVVVARPSRAHTVLPVAAVLAGSLLITAIIDLSDGRVPLLGEALHLPELASVLVLWLLATSSWRPRRQTRRDVPAGSAPSLRVVDDDRLAG